MFVEKLNDRELAKIYAHFIYRDTDDLEKIHCRAAVMDQDVYEQIYKVISKRMRSVKRNHKVLAAIANLADLEQKLKAMYPTRGMEFLKYTQEIQSYCKYRPGREWTDAILLDSPIDKDMAAYILSGVFSESCEKHLRLNDHAMKHINQDIHNRIYTLICRGLLF